MHTVNGNLKICLLMSFHSSGPSFKGKGTLIRSVCVNYSYIFSIPDLLMNGTVRDDVKMNNVCFTMNFSGLVFDFDEKF